MATEFGILIDVKLLHPLKASLPIEVIEFPMVMAVSVVQSWNADVPMVIMELGITM